MIHTEGVVELIQVKVEGSKDRQNRIGRSDQTPRDVRLAKSGSTAHHTGTSPPETLFQPHFINSEVFWRLVCTHWQNDSNSHVYSYNYLTYYNVFFMNC